MEKDLPTLREIVGGAWKKEEELKALKSEVAALERKIQQTLAPPDKTEQATEAVERPKEQPIITPSADKRAVAYECKINQQLSVQWVAVVALYVLLRIMKIV